MHNFLKNVLACFVLFLTTFFTLNGYHLVKEYLCKGCEAAPLHERVFVEIVAMLTSMGLLGFGTLVLFFIAENKIFTKNTRLDKK